MDDAAAILVIGNEILTGKVRDTNSPFLLDELRALGHPVACITVIPDDRERIAAAVGDLSRRHEVVFTTGGVGPTLDDVTMEGVALAFGEELVVNPDLEAVIRAHFGPRLSSSHLKMAHLPRGARISWGAGLAWPVVECRNVVVLPGDPEILRKKFIDIRERFRRRPYHLRRVFTLQEEVELAPLLERVHQAHPDVALGSYPVYNSPEYSVQITVEAKDRDAVDRALEGLKAELVPGEIVRID